MLTTQTERTISQYIQKRVLNKPNFYDSGVALLTKFNEDPLSYFYAMSGSYAKDRKSSIEK